MAYVKIFPPLRKRVGEGEREGKRDAYVGSMSKSKTLRYKHEGRISQGQNLNISDRNT